MSTTMFFEEKLYPPNKENGRADKEKSYTHIEILRTNCFGDDQIYLKINSENERLQLHLTKNQAKALADSLTDIVQSIGYDNR